MRRQNSLVHITCELSQAASFKELLHWCLRLVFEHEQGHRALKLTLTLQFFLRVTLAAWRHFCLRELDCFLEFILLDQLDQLLFLQVEQKVRISFQYLTHTILIRMFCVTYLWVELVDAIYGFFNVTFKDQFANGLPRVYRISVDGRCFHSTLLRKS